MNMIGSRLFSSLLTFLRYMLRKRFVRFLLVGGVNTLFGYGVFAFFIFFGFHYSIASLLSIILGVLFNFKTTGFFVFRNTENHRILRYVGVYAFSYLFNLGGLKLLHEFGINNYIAGAVLILPSAVLTYVLSRELVFRSKLD